MGNSNSNFSKEEKDIYLREIKRLTDQNRNTYPHVTTSNNNPLDYTDKQKTDLQNKLMISHMQKQIAQNHAEINRLQTGNYNSSYSKIASQQNPNPTQNSGNVNPQIIKQILNNPNASLSQNERQQLQSYLISSNNNQSNPPHNQQQRYNQQPPQLGYNNQQNQQQPQQGYNNQQQQPQLGYNNQQQPQLGYKNNNPTYKNQQNNKPGFMHQNMGTRNYYQDKEIVKLDLDNSIETLSKSYYTEEEQDRINFELDEKKRRQEFEDRQKKRRVEFNVKLDDFEQGPINAQKLFELPDNYTLDMLNKAYRKLALKTHPDRPGGSNQQFKTVTQSYMLLMEKYKEKEQDKTYYDLKRGSDSFFEKQKDNMDRVGKMDKDRFDAKLFNKIYEKNRLYDPNDEGYGNWFQGEENTYEQPKIFSDKFNLNVFNTVFDQMKTEHKSTQIEKRHDPSALVSKSDRIGFTELGGGDINNFGKETIKCRDLNFSDLREAYTKTHLINPNAGEYRKDYKNIEELKKDRANINFTPDKAELRRQEMEKIRERELEDRRIRRLKTYDNVVEDHHKKVHTQLLGFNPDVDKQLAYD
jgi:curved DNA-binding protein CbpA